MQGYPEARVPHTLGIYGHVQAIELGGSKDVRLTLAIEAGRMNGTITLDCDLDELGTDFQCGQAIVLTLAAR